MLTYFYAIGVIAVVLFGWIITQNWARKFAESHPEFGLIREEGGGCGKNCMCASSGNCTRENQ